MKTMTCVAFRLLLLTFVTTYLSGCANTDRQSVNAGRTYQNPVFAGDMPDPTVRKLGRYYFAAGTTGAKRMADGRIFRWLRSKDLVNWEELGGALVPPTNAAGFHFWAPELAEHRGKFYLYYSMGRPDQERFEIRVGISAQAEGPFVDSGAVVTATQTNRFTIDPFPFRDRDGQWYLFYACNFPFTSDGFHAGTGIAVDRLVTMTRLAGEPRVVIRAAHDWTLYQANRRMDVYNGTFDWHTIEGPCVFQRGGRIYCLYSGANWQTPRYGLDVVTATAPLGPYSGAGDSARVLHGIPGKVRGPGHNSVVTGPDGRTQYVLYHAWDQNMKRRQLCLDKLEWTPDGPRCTPTITPQPVP